MTQTYYGKQTQQALQNFPFPLPITAKEMIYAMAEVKKAAAQANNKANILDTEIMKAIETACDEIVKGKHDNQFVTCSLQGGAGTSINMNVNEVIASRASEVLALQGKHIMVHPNDHVNLSQSTNDANPSALRIATIRLTKELLKSLDYLIEIFSKKTQEYKNVKKLGRTHIQDAVPTTFGEEFGSYITILKRNKKRITEAEKYLYELNIGGTAIGNKINAPQKYIDAVYPALVKITGLSVKPAENFMSFTSNTGDFYHLHSLITLLALDLSKISNDLRFLSSGPNGGIGEISLEALQPGSSIMPGKINPVAPESMNQIYYFISGKQITIEHASEGAHLELAIMAPVLGDAIITSLKLLSAGMQTFADRCIATLRVNEKRSSELLEKSTAYATLLTPILGYDIVSKCVKESIEEQKSIREIILEKKLLSEKEFEKAVKI